MTEATEATETTRVSVSDLIDALPEALILVDAKGDIYWANTQAEWLFSYPRNQLVGSNIESLMPERFREAHRKAMTRYMIQPYTRPIGVGMKLYVLQKNGVEVEVEISLSPIMTTTGIFIIAVLRRVRAMIPLFVPGETQPDNHVN